MRNKAYCEEFEFDDIHKEQIIISYRPNYAFIKIRQSDELLAKLNIDPITQP